MKCVRIPEGAKRIAIRGITAIAETALKGIEAYSQLNEKESFEYNGRRISINSGAFLMREDYSSARRLLESSWFGNNPLAKKAVQNLAERYEEVSKGAEQVERYLLLGGSPPRKR